MFKYKMANLFAGIGGIDLGFEQNGIQTVWANEIDNKCAVTYKCNFPNINLVIDDIQNIKGKDIPKVDILAGGFPCQPFSIAGYRKGFQDDRGNMFFQIMRLVSEMEENKNKPKVLFLENVRNLYSHDKGNTFKVIKETLEEFGYHVHYKVLNTCEYGNIPQNRERIFIIGFLNQDDYDRFEWPRKIKLSKTIKDIIKFNDTFDKKYYYTETQKCYPLVSTNIKNTDTIYQLRRIYVRENKNNLCPTLTANMGTGGHNVPLILDYNNKIRKLLPRECLLFQGFPENYIIPSELADSNIYKQAGNAVSVSVIKRVAEQVIKAMEGDKS